MYNLVIKCVWGPVCLSLKGFNFSTATHIKISEMGETLSPCLSSNISTPPVHVLQSEMTLMVSVGSHDRHRDEVSILWIDRRLSPPLRSPPKINALAPTGTAEGHNTRLLLEAPVLLSNWLVKI